MTNPWQEWKKANAEKQRSGRVSPVDFLNPDTEYVEDDVADARLKICSTCPHLLFSKQCRRCGCFMPAKVRLKNAHCPEALWT